MFARIRLDTFTLLDTDTRTVFQGSRNSCDGNAQFPCNIFHRYVRVLVHRLFSFCKVMQKIVSVVRLQI